MSEAPEPAPALRVDAAVHPVVPHLDVLRGYLDPEWASRPLPGPERYQYLSPDGDDCAPAQLDDGLPGSDIARLVATQLDERGFHAAIAIPPGVGLLPSVRHGSAVAAAVNRWQVEQVLDHPAARGRLFGSIRLDPRDITGSLAEIRTWGDRADIVQAVVPLQSHQPYGTETFFPIWEELATRGLPLAMRLEIGGSVEFHPSAAGRLQYAIDYDVLAPLNYAFHLGSLVGEGVFERLPDLCVIIVDGGWPTLPGLAWRLDKDWRPNRAFLPWMRRRPSEYLTEQVVFCLDYLDFGGADDAFDAWWSLGDTAGLMYASHYPRWVSDHAVGLLEKVPEDRRRDVQGGLASRLYGLDRRAPHSTV